MREESTFDNINKHVFWRPTQFDLFLNATGSWILEDLTITLWMTESLLSFSEDDQNTPEELG